MNLLKEANRLFKDKKYEEAHGLYKQAGEIYGEKIVYYNLQECKKYLDLDSTTIGFYRIIGNNISGLHSAKQNLDSLKFIIDEESKFKNTKKIFILNRIVNLDEKKQLVNYLKTNSIEYIDIEYNVNEFMDIGYDFTSIPDADFWFKRAIERQIIVSRTALYESKNRYLMNNNGARNTALLDGKKRFDWTMPWDGNCFMSDEQFRELSLNFVKSPSSKYVLTPMDRLLENNVNKNSTSVNAIEEPQISFHNTSNEIFNKDRIYGNQPKVELFKRIGYPGKWDEWKNLYSWKKLEFKKSIDYNLFTEASSVFRLASNNKIATKDATDRSQIRNVGIVNFINSAESEFIKLNLDNALNYKVLITFLSNSMDSKLFKKLVINNSFTGKNEKGLKETISTHHNINNNKTVTYISLLLFSFKSMDINMYPSCNIADKLLSNQMPNNYSKIKLEGIIPLENYMVNLFTDMLSDLYQNNINNALILKLELTMSIYYYYSNIDKFNSDEIRQTDEIIKTFIIVFKTIFNYDIYNNLKSVGINIAIDNDINLNKNSSKKNQEIKPFLKFEMAEFKNLFQIAKKTRTIEMTETYVNIIKYLVIQYKRLSLENQKELLSHISNVIKLSKDGDLINYLLDFYPSMLKQLPLSPKSLDEITESDTSKNIKYNVLKHMFYDLHTEPSDALMYILNLAELNQKKIAYKHFIIYCNLFAQPRYLNNKNYLKYINNYFKAYSLPILTRVNLQTNNILGSIEFEKIKPYEKNSMVSIIMSAYNSSETIVYAINSLLNQSYINIEVLVCDDSSDDNTIEKIMQLSKKDKRIRVFKSVKNQGTYNIRNNLIKKAKGTYITFQDSDDYALPNRLERQVNELEKSNKVICLTQWMRIKTDGNFVFFQDDNVSRFCVVSALLKKSVFNDIPKFRQSLVAADTEFYQSIINKYGRENIHQIYAPLILGLADEKSLTNIKGLSAENSGFVAKRRREYSDIAARQRTLGSEIVKDNDVNNVLKKNDIYREDFGVLEFIKGVWK